MSDPCERNCPDHGRQDEKVTRMQRDLDALAALIREEKDNTAKAIRDMSLEIKALREDRIRAVAIIAVVGVIAAPVFNDFIRGLFHIQSVLK